VLLCVETFSEQDNGETWAPLGLWDLRSSSTDIYLFIYLFIYFLSYYRLLVIFIYVYFLFTVVVWVFYFLLWCKIIYLFIYLFIYLLPYASLKSFCLPFSVSSCMCVCTYFCVLNFSIPLRTIFHSLFLSLFIIYLLLNISSLVPPFLSFFLPYGKNSKIIEKSFVTTY
jgi:hypothetical protein